MNHIDDKILGKIKKCLALSTSSEPHEAAAALRQAQKLMEMHGVDQLTIDRSEIGEASVRSKASVSRIKQWELKLLKTISRAFGCELLWIGSNSYRDNIYGQYIFIGLKSQVQLAQYTATVFQRKLMNGRNEFVKTLPAYYRRKEKTMEADGFCYGWIEAVSKTVYDFALTDETKKMIEEVTKERTTGGEAKVQNRAIGQHGVNAGFEAGQNESIHRPVSAKKNLYLS